MLKKLPNLLKNLQKNPSNFLKPDTLDNLKESNNSKSTLKTDLVINNASEKVSVPDRNNLKNDLKTNNNQKNKNILGTNSILNPNFFNFLKNKIKSKQNSVNNDYPINNINITKTGSLYKSSSDILLIKEIVIFTSILCFVFISLFIVSIYLQNKQNSLRDTLNNNLNELDELSSVELRYTEIAESVNLYKDLRQQSSKLYEKLNSVKQEIPESMNINQMRVTSQGFEIALESNNLLDFSFLLDKYLSNKIITTVYLENLSLVPRQRTENIYLFNIRGDF